jgi:ribokinase
MYDVITMGSATVDVFAKTDSELIGIKTSTSERELIAYPLGSKIIINDLQFMIGGGGTNTAVSFSRLGLKTAYLGCIGNDVNGQKILELLQEEHVDFIGTGIDAQSNYSIILDSIEDDRTILIYRDASDKLQYSMIDLKRLQTRWIYSSSLMGESFKTLDQIATYAQKNTIKFALNLSSYLAKKGVEPLRGVLAKTSVLVLNCEEAQLLVGTGTTDHLLTSLSQYGPDIVVVTHGKHGVSALIDDNVFVAEAKEVSIKETTGAGDAFGSGFVAGLILDRDPKFCLSLGMNNAESVIQNYGAKNILLTRDEAFALVEKDDRQITCHHLDSQQQSYVHDSS